MVRAPKFALREFIKHSFTLWERLGFHILPVSYYSQIPELRKLRDVWKQPYEFIGIEIDEEFQIKLLHELSSLYGYEFNSFLLKRLRIFAIMFTMALSDL